MLIRLWMRLSNLSDYPGGKFKEYQQSAIESTKHSACILKAIDMVDVYLHKKIADQSLNIFDYFFPRQGEAT